MAKLSTGLPIRIAGLLRIGLPTSEALLESNALAAQSRCSKGICRAAPLQPKLAKRTPKNGDPRR